MNVFNNIKKGDCFIIHSPNKDYYHIYKTLTDKSQDGFILVQVIEVLNGLYNITSRHTKFDTLNQDEHCYQITDTQYQVLYEKAMDYDLWIKGYIKERTDKLKELIKQWNLS